MTSKKDPYSTVGEVMALVITALLFVMLVLALLAGIAWLAGVVFA